MKKALTRSLAIAVAFALAACSDNKQSQTEVQFPKPATETTVTAPTENPLLQEYSGPYGGVPQFDQMQLDDLKPALQQGMALNLAEIEAIANNPEPPTFANTIAEMERAGSTLNRIFTYWGIWSSNKSSPEFRAIQTEMRPKLSAFFSQITQNEALFARVKAVY